MEHGQPYSQPYSQNQFQGSNLFKNTPSECKSWAHSLDCEKRINDDLYYGCAEPGAVL